MKRRHFLRYGLGVTLAGTSFFSVANMLSHNGHRGQGHSMMMGESSTHSRLMPFNAMPSGSPLNTLPKLANESKQAGIFRGKLTAMPVKLTLAGGKETEFWAYNGQLPGPQIEVYEGDSVEIEFTNRLHQPTTVHWHGLDVPNDADGNPQDPVEPNQTKTYRFTLPKGSAGTYWYHPHPHNFVSEQVYKGLAGTLIVKAKDDPLQHLNEQHWVISDLRLNEDGTIPPNTMLDWMNGREGEFVLINGQYQPQIHLNGNERIRIWNATSSRYLRLNVEGVKWIVVGTDGGLLEKPRPIQDEIFIAPAERVEVIAVGQTVGQVALKSLYYNRRKMMVQETPSDLILGSIQVKSASIELPNTLRILPELASPSVIRQIQFSETMGNMHGGRNLQNPEINAHHRIPTENPIPTQMVGMFLVNGKVFDMNRIDFTGKVGDVEEWEIFNESHMDHPFHLHGTQFEIIRSTVNGKTTNAVDRSRKDTVNLRPYEKVVIRFKQGNSGLKMYHCHILEHENLGMMGMFKVE